MTTRYIITKSPKSTGIAILLTLLFGPVGLFYASVLGGFVMTFIPVILLIAGYYYFINSIVSGNYGYLEWISEEFVKEFTVEFFILGASLPFLYWLITMIWAVIAVRNYNNKIEKESAMYNKYGEYL